MKKSKFWMSGLTVVAAMAALSAATSYAHEGKKDCGPHARKFGPEAAGGPERHFEHRLHALNLSPEQKDKVKQIVDQQKAASEQKFQALHENGKALHEAAKADAYDPKRVQDLASQQAKLQADLIVLRTDTAHQIYALLTPEQKQKWDQRDEKKPHDRS